MKTSVLLFVLLLSSSMFLYGQTTSDSLLAKVDSLKSMLSTGETLTPEEANNFEEDSTVTDINTQIRHQLVSVLSTHSIIKYRLDSLLQHSSLDIAHSKDNRLWIFSWSENTGGSWKSNLNLLCYKSRDKKRYYVIPSFEGNGASFNKIYRLPAKDNDLYLAHGSGISCNTCEYEIAFAIELKGDSINYDYPAFKERKSDINSPGPEFHDSPSFMLEARMGDIKKFEYDAKTKTFNYTYIADDNTPVRDEKFTGKIKITRSLKFNGRKFIGKYD